MYHTRSPWHVVLVLFFGLGGQGMGCTPAPAVTVVPTSASDAAALKGDSLGIRRNAQEAYRGLLAGYYVVRNAEDWRSAWPSDASEPFPSTLNTRTSMLLMAVASEKTMAQVRITNVTETSDFVHVWVRETAPGTNCATADEGAPFEAIVVPRVDKPVKFHVESVQAESCGEPPSAAVTCRLAQTNAWSAKIGARPGDTVECTLRARAHGRFALTDEMLSLSALPGGSATKLSFTTGTSRATFPIDVFGTYVVRAEAVDESGRRGVGTAQIDALPPTTKDIYVELAWSNFDASDDPATFPRAKLHAKEPGPRGRECSTDSPVTDLCEVRMRAGYTNMKIAPARKSLSLSVAYVDERVEQGPRVCVQVFTGGARTAETCDPTHRHAGDRWEVGLLDLATGKLTEPK
ncbi:MAG: hypothetical protein FWD69_13680 [Polyangiaceae bacterium]|nr:hypothetical protein [Polyangiaceae bacterium]